MDINSYSETVIKSMTDVELMRAVDNDPNAPPIAKELAARLGDIRDIVIEYAINNPELELEI